MNIKKSLYWVVFALTVIPFLIFSIITVQIYSGRLKNVITDSLKVVADAQIKEMTNFCEQQKEYLSLIGATEVAQDAANGVLSDLENKYADDMLISYVKQINSMNTLAIIDLNKKVVASSDPDHKEYAEHGIEAIIDKMNDRAFYISNVMPDPEGNETLVLIAKLEKDEHLLGYILGEISLDFYAEIREKATLWNESTLYILDGNQKIISAGTPEEGRSSFVTSKADRVDYTEKYNAIDFKKNPQGSFQYRLGSRNYITYYSDIEYTDWRTMLTVNIDDQLTEQMVYIVMAGFLVFLIIILGGWISLFASRRIIYPVQHISDVLKNIKDTHDYTIRVKTKHDDEMSVLAKGVNELIDFIETEDLYQQQQQRLLQEKAKQDALTKVLNKEHIGSYLQEAIQRHREKRNAMAVLFVDVDDFKAFNTNYGHDVGDQVLLFITSLLAKVTGGVVGRVGGDEFLAVVENVEELDTNLTKINEVSQNQFIVRGKDIRLSITCCIGAIIIDFSKNEYNDCTFDYLISLADKAMYEVKNDTKNGHVIYDFEKIKEVDDKES